jgi:transcriptional regulator with XRE-family HTH domain
MSLSERLKKVRKTLRFSQKKMAKTINIATRTWQVYEEGGSVPGGKVYAALAKLGFNANWLLTGDGPMTIKPHDLAGHLDMVKTVFTGDNDAAKRSQEKGIEVGEMMRAAREKADKIMAEAAAIDNQEKRQEFIYQMLITAEFNAITAEHHLAGLDEFLHYIDMRLTELERSEPDIRAWFRVEFKKRFPELLEEKKETETQADSVPAKRNVA